MSNRFAPKIRPATEQWVDDNGRNFQVCADHANSDDIERSFAVWGSVHSNAALVGGGWGACVVCRRDAGGAAIAATDLLDSAEIAARLGVSESSFRSMRSQPARHRKIDGMPDPIRTIGNAPVWDRVEVEAWLA